MNEKIYKDNSNINNIVTNITRRINHIYDI